MPDLQSIAAYAGEMGWGVDRFTNPETNFPGLVLTPQITGKDAEHNGSIHIGVAEAPSGLRFYFCCSYAGTIIDPKPTTGLWRIAWLHFPLVVWRMWRHWRGAEDSFGYAVDPNESIPDLVARMRCKFDIAVAVYTHELERQEKKLEEATANG